MEKNKHTSHTTHDKKEPDQKDPLQTQEQSSATFRVPKTTVYFQAKNNNKSRRQLIDPRTVNLSSWLDMGYMTICV